MWTAKRCKMAAPENTKGTAPENITNRAFRGAWLKGYRAAQAGESESANPYDDHDMCRGGPTFARAFHRYWRDGYMERSKELTETCPYCAQCRPPDDARVYKCPKCGREGFDCCVPGRNTLCWECENGEPS